jgi:Flp pilus assembly protein TadB
MKRILAAVVFLVVAVLAIWFIIKGLTLLFGLAVVIVVLIGILFFVTRSERREAKRLRNAREDLS